jgi:hypothetical protein
VAKKKKKPRKHGPTPRRLEPARPAQSSLHRHWFTVALATLGTAAALLGLLALMRDDNGDGASIRDLVASSDPGPVHVHGLGINPTDKALFIATHTGLWRVGANERTAKRVGESRQDTMGFTVVGADHFLGSGHPGTTSLPPLLGLIESRNAGRTWQPISLLGEADFHVLRFAGDRVYGYDSSNDRLLVSADGGHKWRQISRPAPLVDLAVAPHAARRVVASAENGLYASRDHGTSWRKLGEVVGLLTWPSPNRLYLVDGAGSVLMSGDSGLRWKRVGEIGGQPAALLGRTPTELYVALHDGTIKRSGDGGRTWSVRSTP